MLWAPWLARCLLWMVLQWTCECRLLFEMLFSLTLALYLQRHSWAISGLISSCWRKLHILFYRLLLAMHESVLPLHLHQNLFVFLIITTLTGDETVTHYGFHLQFFWWLLMLSIFHILVVHLYIHDRAPLIHKKNDILWLTATWVVLEDIC